MFSDWMNPAADSMLPVLLDWAAKGVIVLAGAGVATLLMRKASASARHLVWALAMASVLLLPVLSAALPGWHMLPRWVLMAEEKPAPAMAAAEVMEPMRPAPAEPLSQPMARIETLPSSPSAAPMPAPLSPPQPLKLPAWLVLGWIGGAGLTLCPVLLSYLMLRRLRRSADRIDSGTWPMLLHQLKEQLNLRRPVLLLGSSKPAMPMTWGIFRPVLLLPHSSRQWTAERRRIVLVHELAHVKRRDCLWQLLGQLACGLYWFNPLVWLALKQMQAERERACDDLVLGGGIKGSQYAEQLLEIASNLQAHRMAGYSAIAMARPSKLEGRLLAILDSGRNRKAITWAGVIVAVIVAAAVALPVAVLRAGDGQKDAAASTTATQPAASQPAEPAQLEPAKQQSRRSTETVEIKVVDAKEKPVSGAEVYLVQELAPSRQERNQIVTHSGAVIADASGTARFADMPSLLNSDLGRTRRAYARVPGKKMGFVNRSYARRTGQPPEEPIVIVLEDSADLRGQTRVPEGYTPDQVLVEVLAVRLEPSSLSRLQSFDTRDRQTGEVLWPELFRVHAHPDGSFTVRDVPAGGTVYLAANAPGLGEAQAMVTQSSRAEVVQLRLDPAGTIEGTLTYRDTKKPAAGARVAAWPGSEALPVGHPFVSSVGADGRFRITGLPQNEYTLAIDPASISSEWTMAARDKLRVAQGQTVKDIALELEHGAVLSGRVVDAESAKGIEAVSIRALSPNQPNGIRVAHAFSQADGSWSMRVPTGESYVYIDSALRQYNQPDAQTIRIEAGQQANQGVIFSLTSAPPAPQTQQLVGDATIKGRVIDEAGKPVQGVQIGRNSVLKNRGRTLPMSNPRAATTDDQGRYTFQTSAGAETTVFVSSPGFDSPRSKPFTPAANQTVTVEDLIVHPRPVVSQITGIVVDPQGKPIAGAVIGDSLDPESPRTNDAGRFTLPLREKDQPVVLLIEKPGYQFRNWNDVPPGSSDLKFVLYETDDPRHFGQQEPPDPRALLGKPAPKLDISQWIFTPGGQAPQIPPQDKRRTIVMFEYNANEPSPAAVLERIKQVEGIAAKADAVVIVVFSPTSHEAGVRFALKQHAPIAAIGIDRFIPKSPYTASGATVIAYGRAKMPTVFVIDGEGIVRHTQSGFEGLAEALAANMPGDSTHLAAPAATQPTDKAKPLAAGDHLLVKVWDLSVQGKADEFERVVPEDGTINLDPAERIKVKVLGLSEAEAELAVQKAYRDAKLIQQANVECRRLAEPSSAPANVPAGTEPAGMPLPETVPVGGETVSGSVFANENKKQKGQ